MSAHVEAVKRLTSQCPSLHPRELAYAHFLQTYAAGDLLVATEILAVMLRDYPLGEEVGGRNLKELGSR